MITAIFRGSDCYSLSTDLDKTKDLRHMRYKY